MHKQNLPPINNQQLKQRPAFCQIYCYKPNFIKNNSPPIDRRINESYQSKVNAKKHIASKNKQSSYSLIKKQQNLINKQAKKVNILRQPDQYGQNIMKIITNKINKDKMLIQKRKSLSFNQPINLILIQQKIKQEEQQKIQDTKRKSNQLVNQKCNQPNYKQKKQLKILQKNQQLDQQLFQNVKKDVYEKNNVTKQGKEAVNKNRPSRSFIIKKKTSLYEKNKNQEKKQTTQLYINHLIKENFENIHQNNQNNSPIRPIKVIKIKGRIQSNKPIFLKKKFVTNHLQKEETQDIKTNCQQQEEIEIICQKQQKLEKQRQQFQKIQKNQQNQKQKIEVKDYDEKYKQENQLKSKRQKLYSKTNLLTQTKNEEFSILIQSSKSIVFKNQKLPFSTKGINHVFSNSIKKNKQNPLQVKEKMLLQENKQKNMNENVEKIPQNLKKQKKSISQVSSRKVRASSIKNIKCYYYPEQKNQKVQFQGQMHNNTLSKQKVQPFSHNDSVVSKSKKDDSLIQKTKTLKQKQVQCFTHKINWGRRNSKRQKLDQESSLKHYKKQNNFLNAIQTQNNQLSNNTIQSIENEKIKQVQTSSFKQQPAKQTSMSKQFIQFEDPGLSAIFKKNQFCKQGKTNIFSDINRQNWNLNLDEGPLQSLQDLYCQLGSFKQFSNIEDNQFKQN